jgi:predicted nucleotidyltransferase
MKYYKLNQEVYAFESDGSQDEYISKNMVKMSEDDVDRHINPEKYLSDIEKAQLNRERMPRLTPIEFDIKLVDAGLYDQVQELIQSDIKLKIAYTRATFFSRTDAFIDQARIALGLTDEQVDSIWESSLV